MGQGQVFTTRASDSSDPPAVEPLIVLAGVLIIVAALMGGGSRAAPLRLAAVELTSLPLAALAIQRLARGGAATPVRRALWPLGLLGLTLVLPLLQMTPLPPSLWTLLPGAAPRAQALALAGLPLGWAPMSLNPDETGRMTLALTPPVAMVLAMLVLGPAAGRRLAGLWLVMATVGLLLGLGQIAAPGGPAYLFAVTNVGSLVGLFANRNHEAGFLLALLPFAAAFATPGRGRAKPAEGPNVMPWLAGLFIVMAVVALTVIRSRTGVLLAGPALAAAMLAPAGQRRRRGAKASRASASLIAAVGIALLVVAALSLTPVLERFALAVGDDPRLKAWPYVIAAAWAHQPFGAGLGAFDRVYQTVEPLTLVGPTYFNHAHNEFLELWLETGWPGVALLTAFGVWFLRASVAAWRSGSSLTRAASAAVLLMLAESVTDYPLRTETMAVLMAFCCGLLAAQPPPRRGRA
jgi:O-antigen ligase